MTREEIEQIIKENAQRTYEVGRQVSIQTKGFLEKISYFVGKNNYFVLLVCVVCFTAIVYFYNAVIDPAIQRWNGIAPASSHHATVEEFHLLKGSPPFPDADYVIRIPASNQETQIVLRKDGVVMDNGVGVTKTSYRQWFDWSPHFGIGPIVAPGHFVSGNEISDMVFPAVFYSPLEIVNRVELDLYAGTQGFGGGASFRIPVKVLHNSFLGAGVSVPYDDIKQIGFCLYGKVNF